MSLFIYIYIYLYIYIYGCIYIYIKYIKSSMILTNLVVPAKVFDGDPTGQLPLPSCFTDLTPLLGQGKDARMLLDDRNNDPLLPRK